MNELRIIQYKIKDLCDKSYKHYTDGIENVDDKIVKFFGMKCISVENSSIFIHVPGCDTKIKNGKDYEWDKIKSGDFEQSPFEEFVIKNIEN